MANKLTKKQKGFVKDYALTGNGVQSALANYNTTDYTTANSIARENLQKPAILNALDTFFPDDELFKIHREGLYEENPFARHKFLVTAYQLKDKLKGNLEDSHGASTVNVVVFNVNDPLSKQLEHPSEKPEAPKDENNSTPQLDS